jgi:hypothetical protein
MQRDLRLGLGVVVGLFVLGLAACTPGYMKVKDLDRREQGPTACASRCQELGMRMGALVLVSNEVPGCVCEPLPPPSVPNAPSDPAKAVSGVGASAAMTGEVVIAAAAAAQQQQQQRQQQQQQQNYKSSTHY